MLRPFFPETEPPDERQLSLIRSIVDQQMGPPPTERPWTGNPAVGNPYPHPSVETPESTTQQIIQGGGLHTPNPDPPLGNFSQGLSYNPGNPAGEFDPTQDYSNQQTEPGMMDYIRGIPGSIRKSVGGALEDPTRRAMIAFGAKMMDFSSPKWQQFETGTQISHAIQAGLDEYARATKTKAPKVAVRKFTRNGRNMGEYGDWKTDSKGKRFFNSYGIEPFYLSEEGEEKGPKYAAPNLDKYTEPTKKRYMDKTSPFFNKPEHLKLLPPDYGAISKTAAAKAEGRYTAAVKNWDTHMEQQAELKGVDLQNKKDFEDFKQDMSMAKWYEKRGVPTPPKRGDHYSWEEGEYRHFEVYDGTKWNRTKSSKWNPQARRGDRLFNMPDGTKMTLGELISLYKAERPEEASGLMGFALAQAGGPKALKAWVENQSGAGKFGKYLDSIGFDKQQLSFLGGREPAGIGQEEVIEFDARTMDPDDGVIYKTRFGIRRWHEETQQWYERSDWGEIWPKR